jgi:hypothetical protein
MHSVPAAVYSACLVGRKDRMSTKLVDIKDGAMEGSENSVASDALSGKETASIET